MLGFSIMMWFVSIILFFVSMSLLKGNYSLMHGKTYDNTNDKEEYARLSGKPILLLAIGIAISGIVAFATSNIIISVIIIVVVSITSGIWIACIQKRFM